MTISLRTLMVLIATASTVGILCRFQTSQATVLTGPVQESMCTPVSPASRMSRVLSQRIAAKTAVIDRLEEGSMDLFEAAAWFRWINEQSQDSVGAYLKHLPGDTIEERTCYQVVSWLTGHLGNRIPHGKVKQIEKEMVESIQRHKKEHGKVILVEWR